VTRTPGFWGTHLDITQCYLPVFSCGLNINNISPDPAGDGCTNANSAIEDLCKNNQDAKENNTSDQQLSLIRQCTAAALNIMASQDLGGSCTSRLDESGAAFGIENLYAACCGLPPNESIITSSVCTAGETGTEISASRCIDAIDAFNQDSNTLNGFYDYCPNTLSCTDGTMLVKTQPCNADSSACQIANGNGCVNPDRNLGSKK
jgi:hypothetical protein